MMPREMPPEMEHMGPRGPAWPAAQCRSFTFINFSCLYLRHCVTGGLGYFKIFEIHCSAYPQSRGLNRTGILELHVQCHL